MKHEALKAKNRIIEKARKLKFEERDETKTFNRALQHSEVIDNNYYHLRTKYWITVLLIETIFQVFKERAIQLNFNKTEREKNMEKNLMIFSDQNREIEQYKKDQIEEKQKNTKLKRVKAEMLLKE